MSEYTEDDLKNLTDAERAALEADEGEGNQGESGNEAADANAGTDAGNQGENAGAVDAGAMADAAADAGAAASADAANAAQANTAQADTANAEPAAQEPVAPVAAAPEAVKPILVAQAPTDTDARLKEIADKKAALIEKQDAGDMTTAEFVAELDRLGKTEREIEWSREKAKLAGELELQRRVNEWSGNVDNFIAEHPEYDAAKNPSMNKLLDFEIRRLGETDEFKNGNSGAIDRVILQRAHENISGSLGLLKKGDAPAAKAKGIKPDLPPNLNKIPAADINAAGEGGEFAALDRLANADTLAYEEALMKLPDAKREQYLASAQ